MVGTVLRCNCCLHVKLSDMLLHNLCFIDPTRQKSLGGCAYTVMHPVWQQQWPS